MIAPRVTALAGLITCLSMFACAGSGEIPAPAAPNRAATASATSSASIVQLAGADHTCALDASGHVRCWGNNEEGQLGDGTRTASTVPVLVAQLNDATSVATGLGYTCAARRSGEVDCWGRKLSGHLNFFFAFDHGPAVPRPVAGLGHVRALGAGLAKACGVRDDGTVVCWGMRGSAASDPPECAKETRYLEDRCATPVVIGGLAGVVEVAPARWGSLVNYARTQDGRVACWEDSHAASAVEGVYDAAQLVVESERACVRRRDGGVTCWAGASACPAPGIAPALTTISVDHATSLASTDHSTCALLADGTVACWGPDGARFPEPVADARVVPVKGIDDAIAIGANDDDACAVRRDGEVACWGRMAAPTPVQGL
jgi:Regulator of Chromosome Condensation (RCC1) repeat protein